MSKEVELTGAGGKKGKGGNESRIIERCRVEYPRQTTVDGMTRSGEETIVNGVQIHLYTLYQYVSGWVNVLTFKNFCLFSGKVNYYYKDHVLCHWILTTVRCF